MAMGPCSSRHWAMCVQLSVLSGMHIIGTLNWKVQELVSHHRLMPTTFLGAKLVSSYKIEATGSCFPPLGA